MFALMLFHVLQCRIKGQKILFSFLPKNDRNPLNSALASWADFFSFVFWKIREQGDLLLRLSNL